MPLSISSTSSFSSCYSKEPHIELDYTLQELYQRTTSKGGGIDFDHHHHHHGIRSSTTPTKNKKNIIRVLSFPNSKRRVSPHIDLCSKYQYHNDPFPDIIDYRDVGKRQIQDDFKALRDLGLKSQSHALVAGKMPLFAFDASHTLDNFEFDFRRSLEILEPRIRPDDISFCKGFLDMPIVGAGASDHDSGIYDCECDYASTTAGFPTPEIITSNNAMDGLDGFRHRVKQELLYELQSKRCLALSNIKSPKAHILDFHPVGFPPSEHEVIAHDEKVIWHFRGQTLPFEVLLQQGNDLAGRYSVTNEQERMQLIAVFEGLLPRLLGSVNFQNSRLHPATIIVAEKPTSPKPPEVASFFVYEDGTYTFFGSCKKIAQQAGNTHGGDNHPHLAINFSSQSYDAKHLKPTLTDVAKFLSSKGYTGPVSIETVLADDLDNIGSVLVTDLKLGVHDGMLLSLLRTYLFEERGFRRAASYQYVRLGGITRDDFTSRFSDDIWNGSLTVVGWVSEKGGGPTWASLVVAGHSIAGIERMMERVKIMTGAVIETL